MALLLLEQMPGVNIRHNVITYSTTITACEKVGQWDQALSLLEEMPGVGISPDGFTYNAFLDAVCTSHPTKARELYSHARSLYGSVEGTELGDPKLDLHKHSEGAAETAVRWWLGERVHAMTGEPERLIIVTGWGKSRSATSNSDLRTRVERLLTELHVPTIPVRDKLNSKGCFFVDGQAWIKRTAKTTHHSH